MYSVGRADCSITQRLMSRIRVARAGRELGEYTEDQVRLYLASGNLVPGDYGWQAGMTGWKTLSEMGYSAVQASAPPPPPGITSAPPNIPVSASVPRGGIQPRGSYIRESMARDEILLYEGSVSWAGFVTLLICCGFFVTIFGLIALRTSASPVIVVYAGLFSAMYCYINYLMLSAIELGVTNRRVIAKTGIISREIIEVRNDKIEGVQIKQPMLGRAFDFGTVIIRGSGQTEVPLQFISDPLAFRRAVDEVARR